MRTEERSIVAVVSLLIFLSCAAQSGVAQQSKGERKMDKITGKLLRVLAVGAESTGWVVKFDGGQKVGGATLKQIEVDPRPNKIQLGALRNKRVEVTGTLTSHRGIERGERRVLVIEAIRVVNAP